MADQDTLAQFCAVTGADVSVGNQMLDAAGGNLESAVQLFFASGEGEGERAGGGLGASHTSFEDDEALARRLHQYVPLWGWTLD